MENEPRQAPANMACDQHLLELMEKGLLKKPVLRLYSWQTPTLSLGYHQRWRETVDQEALKRHGIQLVRRWTGGRGVLHESGEITYSVVAPMSQPFKGQVAHNYQLIGMALQRFTFLDEAQGTLSETGESAANLKTQRGLPCFATLSQSEIESRGQKLIGSAQKLGRQAFLQHGSIPMHHRHRVLAEITATTQDVSQRMASMGDLYERAAQTLPDKQGIMERLVKAFSESFAVRFRNLNERNLPDEREVQRISQERFSQDKWTFRK